MTKMTLTFALLTAFTLFFSGCNKPSSGDNAATPAPAAPVDTTTTPPTVAADSSEQARTFYNQFLYRLEGDCRRPETRPFRSLTNLSPIAIEKSRDQRDLAIHLLLNLYDKGTYVGVYSESLVVSGSGAPDELRYKTLFHSKVEGRWSVVGSQIELEGLGLGTPLVGNGTNKIMFKITRQLNHRETLNALVPLELVKSSFGDCR